MEIRCVTCSDCGTELPMSYSSGGAREPCPTCGGAAITVHAHGTVTARVTVSHSYSVSTTNDAPARRRELEETLRAVEAGAEANALNEVHVAVKRALEAVHELADCLARGEWRQAGWAVDSVGLWHAHLGARNAAHHTSSAVVALHGGTGQDTHFVWDLEAGAVGSLRSKRQAAEYYDRLDGQAVLPTLRPLVALISSSVP